MIRFSQALVLTPPLPALGLNNGIIGWHTMLAPGDVEAEHEDASHPASELLNVRTDLQWRSDTIGEQHLTMDMSAEVEPDYVGVAGHNFGSAGISVELQGNADDETPDWQTLVAPFVPADDAPIILRFPAQSLVGLRLVLGTGDAPPRAAILYAGRLTVLQRRTYVGHTPITDGYLADVTQGRARSGAFLGTIITGERSETSVSLQNLTPYWYREHLRPVMKSRRPFFYGWRPLSYPHECGFVWFPTGSNPQPSNQRPNGMMEVSFDLEGIVA